MLKASAWPYPIFQEIAFDFEGANFGGRTLETKQTPRGHVVIAQSLRERSGGDVIVSVKIRTLSEEIIRHVFDASGGDEAECGFRILCEASKYRTFVPAIPGESTNIALPLDKIRGVAAITPVFVAARDCTARDGTTLVRGALLGASADAIFVTVDEDWTGQIIPIDWLDFSQAQPPLPDEADIVLRLALVSMFRPSAGFHVFGNLPRPRMAALDVVHTSDYAWQRRIFSCHRLHEDAMDPNLKCGQKSLEKSPRI